MISVETLGRDLTCYRHVALSIGTITYNVNARTKVPERGKSYETSFLI